MKKFEEYIDKEREQHFTYSQEVAARAAYRFAFETIKRELKENCAWWKFEDLQEFINEELDE